MTQNIEKTKFSFSGEYLFVCVGLDLIIIIRALEKQAIPIFFFPLQVTLPGTVPDLLHPSPCAAPYCRGPAVAVWAKLLGSLAWGAWRRAGIGARPATASHGPLAATFCAPRRTLAPSRPRALPVPCVASSSASRPEEF